jgi:hypothetical protein
MINNLSVEFPKEKNLCGGFANEKKKLLGCFVACSQKQR